MRAQVINTYGGPGRFQLLDDMPIPRAGKGQVRIRVHTIAINPLDAKIRSGSMNDQMPVTFPLVLGSEAAGVVEHVGEGVTDHQVGDQVVGLTETGAYAEFAILEASKAALVPQGLGLKRAATLPTAAETSQRGISWLTPKHGETIVVNGAAGSVGSAAVQLLARYGCHVIGTASEDNHDYLRSLGATPTTYGDGVVQRIRDLAPDGIHAVFDVGGHGFLDAALELCDSAARIVTISDFTAWNKGVHVSLGMSSLITSADYAPILRLAATGEFRTEILQTFSFHEVAEAHELSERGHVRGKIVVTGLNVDADA